MAPRRGCLAAETPMLGRRQELNIQWQKFLDGLLLAAALWGAHRLRFEGMPIGPFADRPIAPFPEFQWLLFVVAPFGPFLLGLQGFYLQTLHKPLWRAAAQVVRSGLWLALLVAACAYLLRLSVPSRAVMPLFALLASALLLTRERLTSHWMRRRAASLAMREPVILAGTRADTELFRASLTEDQRTQVDIVAEFDLAHQPVAELTTALHTHAVSRVIFAGGHSALNKLQEAIAACEVEGVEAWLTVDFIRTSIARPAVDLFGSSPMLVFRTTPEVSWALLLKAVMDRVGAALGLVLGAPLFAVIALLIKCTSPGPVLFRQERGGLRGRPFTLYKFRSMHSDAAMHQAELEAFNEMSGPVFKLSSDPRVTALGRWLRKTSLDELPQLWNVLRGDMSLVGPRPLPLYELAKISSGAERRRLSMKPGLTCLWQVSGRSDVRSFQEWVRLDLQYIDQWSLRLDLLLLLRTIPVVLLGRGAH